MKTNKAKSIHDIDPDIILSQRKPAFAEYDNKKLINWKHDDFASYIFDQENLECTLMDNYFSEAFGHYLVDLQKVNQKRCYLYGLWDVVYSFVKSNKKSNEK